MASASVLLDGLLRRAAAVGVHVRQHHETGLGVFVAVKPGDGHEMRNLPERQNREQRPAFAAQFIARRRPAHQRRQRAGNRADERVHPRHALERRVNEKIADRSHRADDAGQRIDERRQINQAGDRTHAAKNGNGRRLQAARRQRPARRAAHFGVVFAFEQLVQRRRAGRDERGAEQRVKHQQIIHRAAFAEIKADESRQQHQRGQPRLDQVGENRRPAFFQNRRCICDASADISFHSLAKYVG